MRTPSFLIAITLASVLSACSDTEPRAEADPVRDLDLALSDANREGVATPLEVERAEKAKPPASTAPRRSHTADAMAHRAHETPAVVVTTPEPALLGAAPPIDGEVITAVADDPASTTAKGADDPESQTSHPKAGPRGGWNPVPTGAGVERPGREPAIIIRGGGHGDDACDERDVIGGVGRPGGIAARPGLGGRTGGEGAMNPRGPTTRGPVGRTY